MLKTYITDFLAYCKVANLADKSIESLGSSLQDLFRSATDSLGINKHLQASRTPAEPLTQTIG
jgi:hypothetical protein